MPIAFLFSNMSTNPSIPSCWYDAQHGADVLAVYTVISTTAPAASVVVSDQPRNSPLTPNVNAVITMVSAPTPATYVAVSDQPQHSSQMPIFCAVYTVASAPAPAASVAVSDQPQNPLPMPTLWLPTDGTSPPPHLILPLPNAAQIDASGIAATHAHEIDSIA